VASSERRRGSRVTTASRRDIKNGEIRDFGVARATIS